MKSTYRIYGLIGLVTLACTLKLTQLIRTWGSPILFWDQWDFYKPYFDQSGLWAAFRYQHSPHRQGLGAWVIALSDSLSAWDTRFLAYVLVALLLIASVMALRLKVKFWGPLKWTDAVIPALFLRVGQYESLVITANPAHGIVPLLITLCACFVLSWRLGLSQSIALGLLSFFAANTGFGIFLCPLLFALTGLRFLLAWRQKRMRDLRFELLSNVLIGIGLTSFLIGYRHGEFASECVKQGIPSPLHWAAFMTAMFNKYFAFGRTHAFMLISGMIAFVLPATVFALRALPSALIPQTSHTKRNQSTSTCLLLGFSLLYAFNAAIGRHCLGLSVAQSSRYLTHMVPLGLGLYLSLLTLKASAQLRQILLGTYAVVAVGGALYLSQADKHTIESYSGGKIRWAECYRNIENIADCDQTAQFQVYPVPEATQLKQKLDFLKEHQLNLFKESGR